MSASTSSTYFDGHDVAPLPNADDGPYWRNCAERRLTFQQCADCGQVTHPPIGVCPRCQSFARKWIEAPALARVFSFTWIHTKAHDSVTRTLPYNVAVVEFPALPGVRLISNVIDADPGELRIGDRNWCGKRSATACSCHAFGRRHSIFNTPPKLLARGCR